MTAKIDFTRVGDDLKLAHAGLTDRFETLARATENAPKECDDEVVAGQLSDLIQLITAARKSIEAARQAEKEPYLKAGRVVDGFFSTMVDQLDRAKLTIRRPLDAWLKQEADKERRRRLEEAEKLQQGAEKLRRDAEKLEKAGLTESAVQARTAADAVEEDAKETAATAAEKPGQLTAARGSYGAKASLATTWVGEVVDSHSLDLEALRYHIPLEALEKAVGSFVRAGGRTLTGAKIYEKTEARVR